MNLHFVIILDPYLSYFFKEKKNDVILDPDAYICMNYMATSETPFSIFVDLSKAIETRV